MQILILAGNFLLFLLLVLVVFYPFGYWVLKKTRTKLKEQEIICLSLLVSLVSFVLLTLLLGLLNLRFLILPVVLGFLYLAIKTDRKLFISWKIIWKDKILLGLVMLAILVQGFINFPSGYQYPEGLLFWSAHGNDGSWHITLMEETKKSMPLVNPIYSGENLYNYHYFVDIIMGEFGRIFPLFSSLDLYFRFFPVLFSFLISLSVFSFLTRWKKNKKVGYWGIFFSSLVGSFGYIVTLMRDGNLFAGESIFWSGQGNAILINPPFAISYAFVAGTLLSLLFYLNKRSKSWFFITFLLGGFLVGFKVAAGFVLIIGLGIAGILDFIIKRRKGALFLSFVLGLSNLILVKLTTKDTTSFVIFEPWWFIRTMVVAPDRLNWLDMELRRQHYIYVGTWKAWLRVIQLETTALAIFIIGNLGTRVFGFVEIGKKFFLGLKKPTSYLMDITLLGAMLAGVGVTLLFVQKGIAWNMLQFFNYFILIFGFYSAIVVVKLFSKINNKALNLALAVLLILVSIPTSIGSLMELYGPGRTALAKVSNEELLALGFLRNISDEGVLILTQPFNHNAHYDYKEQPWPISVWYDTAYVSALSAQRTYLSNEVQADIIGVPVKERRELVDKFFEQEDYSWNKKFLRENHITHIYLRKADIKQKVNMEENDLEIIFNNNEAIIFKVI